MPSVEPHMKQTNRYPQPEMTNMWSSNLPNKLSAFNYVFWAQNALFRLKGKYWTQIREVVSPLFARVRPALEVLYGPGGAPAL